MDLHDLTHRIIFTFIEAFTGTLISLGAADYLADLDLGATVVALVAAAGAGLGSVLVVIKEYARRQLTTRHGNRNDHNDPPGPVASSR